MTATTEITHPAWCDPNACTYVEGEDNRDAGHASAERVHLTGAHQDVTGKARIDWYDHQRDEGPRICLGADGMDDVTVEDLEHLGHRFAVQAAEYRAALGGPDLESLGLDLTDGQLGLVRTTAEGFPARQVRALARALLYLAASRDA